jgi:hypothetical protein
MSRWSCCLPATWRWSPSASEVWYDTAESAEIEISTDAVVRTKTAKEYVGGHRLYGLVEATCCGPSTWRPWGRSSSRTSGAAWSDSSQRVLEESDRRAVGTARSSRPW